MIVKPKEQIILCIQSKGSRIEVDLAKQQKWAYELNGDHYILKRNGVTLVMNQNEFDMFFRRVEDKNE